MKKNSIISLLAAIPAFILCTIVRLLQITGGTDMQTGVLFDDNGFLLNFGYYGLLIITAAAVAGLCFLDKKKGSSLFSNDIRGFVDGKAIMLGFPMLIAGALALYDGYAQSTSLTPSAFLMFVNYLFGGVLLILGFVVLYKKEIKPGLGFCMCIPAIYYTLRGMCVFLDRMVVASIPEYLIETLSIIGAAIFFMLLTKLFTGNEGKMTRTVISAVGITTSVMCLSNTVAVILADVMNINGVGERIVTSTIDAERANQAMLAWGRLGYHMAYPCWTDVVFALGILLVVVAMYITDKPESPAESIDVTESEKITVNDVPADSETE